MKRAYKGTIFVLAYCEGRDFEKTLLNIDMFKPFIVTAAFLL